MSDVKSDGQNLHRRQIRAELSTTLVLLVLALAALPLLRTALSVNFGVGENRSSLAGRNSLHPKAEATQPDSVHAAHPLQDKRQPFPTALTSAASPSLEDSADSPTTPTAAAPSGLELYQRHCSGCHGERGDGQGIAAPFLFPKPRDFRAGRFRLVSTDNFVPTPEDLDAVLVRGMPGSSMPPWGHLSAEERRALAEQVMQFRKDGVAEEYVRVLKEEDEMTDEEIADEEIEQEIADAVQRATVPGQTTEVPQIGEPDEEAIARGRETYVRLACVSCHGKEGKGDGVDVMFDSEGFPTRARDYTVGIFKGGHDPASLYRRIAYGMPGTPMPSTPASIASPQQVVDLVHFLRSLSDEVTRQAAILQRRKITVRRVARLPLDPDADQWSSASAMHLSLTPLWWRDRADPAFHIQAVHDGSSIALRLSWTDATADRHAMQTEAFEDAVAVELYRGPAEPFLGMGDPTVPVDVWFWDADRADPTYTVEQAYPNMVSDLYPLSEPVAESAEYRRPGASLAAQPPLSLPALASGNPIVPRPGDRGASHLTVGGPGSVTFHLPDNQSVQTRGARSANQWTVVFVRPLHLDGSEASVSLDAGGRASIAFALWDGSLGDRNGQKLVSIWHDLELEE
jgi:mono/diheme cytochrome c family protein